MASKKPFFEPVDLKASFPQMEDETIKFWKKKKIFEKSISTKPVTKTWTFLDGPPFITGLPHYGSLLSSIPKDLFPRFWTMKGYRVRRVWGWDCHGLPAENKVEGALGIKRKKDIEEKVGIKKFIDECKTYVSQVSSEWEWYVDHVGRWVDFKNAYKTMDTKYMESVMWVFSQMYQKGFIYKGLRVSLFCPHCGTPISNFEVAMDGDNYKEITEKSNTYKYELAGTKDTYFLAWSTTPWNKLATPALAVNPNLTYVKVQEGKEKYILAKSAISHLKTKKYKILDEFPGSKLVGIKFIPHYDFFKVEEGKNAFVVIPGEFVTAQEGTGIVTIAVYGEEDLTAMDKNNIQIVTHVDDAGMVTGDSPVGAGMYYLDVNKLVNDDLESRNLMYKETDYTHTIPTCWRCHTRLFYSPQNAWYVDIQKLKPSLLKSNDLINWYPEHFKLGRFAKSMEAAPDWCISRSRYWGSPVPVWECECGWRFVPSSISELNLKSGVKLKDLHKPEIDEVFVNCDNCGKKVHRVPEVLDSWIEAASASIAERHFPFEKNLKLEEFFPPDFIVEYTGQIRAWFYVLHVVANAIFESSGYKNVLVTGVVLGTDGRKMSKNFGNYPDPKVMLSKYGGDALRLYLMGSPVMQGEDIAISEENYRNQVKNFLLTFWNVYNFFVTYANLDSWKPNRSPFTVHRSPSILDKWILARLDETTIKVTNGFESYNTVATISELEKFIKDLSLWYVRRSRDRVGPAAQSKDDKNAFYYTTYHILHTTSRLLAPITPFISEVIYKNLTKEESVHLTTWPVLNLKSQTQNSKLLEEMQIAREIVEKGHALRKEKQIAVRQPLNSFSTKLSKISKHLEYLIKDELNIKNIIFSAKSDKLDTKITPELEEESNVRELARKIQEERKQMKLNLTQKVSVSNDWLPQSKKLLEWLMVKAQIKNLTKGKFRVKNA